MFGDWTAIVSAIGVFRAWAGDAHRGRRRPFCACEPLGGPMIGRGPALKRAARRVFLGLFVAFAPELQPDCLGRRRAGAPMRLRLQETGSRRCGDDAAIRTGGTGPPLQSQRRRRHAQPRLCLRHEGARNPEARLRRSLFLASARSRGHPHRPQARRRHHRRGDAARHDRGYGSHARRRSTRRSAKRSAASSTG